MLSAPISQDVGRLLRISDLADAFQVSERTIFSWLSKGKLPGVVRIEGTTRIPEAAMLKFIQSGGEK